MYKNLPSDIKKVQLDANLYKLHKDGTGKSHFGMDNTPELLDNGFGLYSTVDVKDIDHIKTEYFRISLTRKGSATFNIGLEEYKPRRNVILFGIPGQIFSLRDISHDFSAYYALFTENFISGTTIFKNRRWQFPFLNNSGVQCFELNEETAEEIENIFYKMDNEVKANTTHCSDAIKAYIQLILINASRNYDLAQLSGKGIANPSNMLYSKYVKLVAQHFLTVRKVADYADMLHVSPDYLNRSIKTCANKTAHDLIDEMLLMEAKVYLLHSQLTISEIAYKLEFADPSHFNRFFKKLSSYTPLEFRNQSE